jgi:hypothetical protein
VIPERRSNRGGKRRWERVSWWYSLLFAVPAVALVLTLAFTATASEDGLSGVVRDAYTGKGVPDANISTANATARTDGDGSFSVDDPNATAIAVAKEDYASTEVLINGDDESVQITIRPTTLEGTVKNKRTGKPIEGAVVTVVGQNDETVSDTTDVEGKYRIEQVPPDATISVSYDGYTVDSKPVAQSVMDFEIRPDALVGKITDEAGNPVEGATISIGSASTRSAADGTYKLGGIPDSGTVRISRAGFEATESELPDSLRLDASLKVFRVYAIYVSAQIAALDDEWADRLAIADQTRVNAVVLDLKDSTGKVFYDTNVPLAAQIGAEDPILDVPARLKEMKDRGLYTIARIVVFEDPILAEQRPDLAIHDVTTGGLWTTWNGLAWVNAHEREVWQYNIDLAVEAATLGFDEIQLDYIRFPSDGLLENADYGAEYANETRVQAISAFLTQMHDALEPTGAYLAVDIFGIALVNHDDSGIGQYLEDVFPLVDIVCPMIYPSHFAPGEFLFDVPNDHPYEVIAWSLAAGIERVGKQQYKIRPWLQDFSYGVGIEYGTQEVALQIQAADEFGGNGWMIWSPSNEYHSDAFGAPE